MGRRGRGAAQIGASARAVATRVLEQVEVDAAYSHVALDQALRRGALSARDRGLATRIVYGALAWQRRLDAELEVAVRGPLGARTEPYVRAALRGALFQLRRLDRVPTHAVVDETVELVKVVKGRGASGFVNAVLRRLARGPVALEAPTDPAARFGLAWSLPDAIARRALARFGEEEAATWAAALNEPPPLTVRANRSRIAPAALVEQLGGAAGRWAPAAVRVEQMNAQAREALDGGLCAVQDEGSQLVGEWLGVPEAGVVWDVCAGQGGKSAQLADLIAAAGAEARVRLLASDLYPRKLERLTQWLERDFGGVAFTTQAGDARQGPGEGAGPFARVLVDAPCSGLGVMRRHPETRWRRTQDDIEALAALQSALLDAAAAAVAPGGALVYAVCTNTIEETREQLRAFLARREDFALAGAPAAPAGLAALVDDEGVMETLPHRHDCDGFFAARLTRRGDGDAG